MLDGQKSPNEVEARGSLICLFDVRISKIQSVHNFIAKFIMLIIIMGENTI